MVKGVLRRSSGDEEAHTGKEGGGLDGSMGWWWKRGCATQVEREGEEVLQLRQILTLPGLRLDLATRRTRRRSLVFVGIKVMAAEKLKRKEKNMFNH